MLRHAHLLLAVVSAVSVACGDDRAPGGGSSGEAQSTAVASEASTSTSAPAATSSSDTSTSSAGTGADAGGSWTGSTSGGALPPDAFEADITIDAESRTVDHVETEVTPGNYLIRFYLEPVESGDQLLFVFNDTTITTGASTIDSDGTPLGPRVSFFTTVGTTNAPPGTYRTGEEQAFEISDWGAVGELFQLHFEGTLVSGGVVTSIVYDNAITVSVVRHGA